MVAGPLGTTAAVASAGTMKAEMTMLPVATPLAVARILYAPLLGSVTGSPQPPVTPNEIVGPSGLSDGSLMSSEPDLRYEPAILKAIRWPAVPVNPNQASWPGVLIVAAAVPPLPAPPLYRVQEGR